MKKHFFALKTGTLFPPTRHPQYYVMKNFHFQAAFLNFPVIRKYLHPFLATYRKLNFVRLQQTINKNPGRRKLKNRRLPLPGNR